MLCKGTTLIYTVRPGDSDAHVSGRAPARSLPSGTAGKPPANRRQTGGNLLNSSFLI